MKDSRSLDELPNDAPAHDMFHDHAFDSLSVHAIIQSRGPTRARCGRKPTSDLWGVRAHLANEHVRALRAAPEATLPHHLDALARNVGIERRSEYLVKRTRPPAVAAFGAAADDDLEPSLRQTPSIALIHR
jgi:hypothetical protein